MAEQTKEMTDLVKIIEESDYKNEEDIKDRLQALYEDFKDKATEILSDGGSLQKICVEAEEWFDALTISPKIKDELRYVPTIIDMLRAYAMKEYTTAPKTTMIWLLLAAVYCVAPIDIIPDGFAGPLGYLDDAGAVWVVLNRARPDIEKFTEWRASKN